ncbi:hypothetical protein BS333_17080 [Vibrio azureus]|uniref:Knr4/Smi1-like domain-containing protein n=1 Tax=Vibrio azureus NBRC 104587 TaxID=1219077 RepID=U3AWR5_9VIBR|nr:SUKH-3 domain-containing protein [Vibrio azureus]AUI88084.1 hypothetical protein BS333_17080 [Vibrio azureus]GAD77662.1 hypothetical protein VAZ01S_085_00080 [Vibrio azureus NBRC 104587]
MQNKSKVYLTSIGWSSDRKVELPEEYSAYSISDIIKNILRNIYGLTLIDKGGYKRPLILTSENFVSANKVVSETIEEFKLPFELYPIGTMDDMPGYLFLDKHGSFYHSDGDISFLGANLDEFIETIVYNERKWVVIEYPEPCMCANYTEGVEDKLTPSQRLTYFSTTKPAPWLYDIELGLIPLNIGFLQRFKSLLRMTK